MAESIHHTVMRLLVIFEETEINVLNLITAVIPFELPKNCNLAIQFLSFKRKDISLSLSYLIRESTKGEFNNPQ